MVGQYKRARVAITTVTQVVPVAQENLIPRYAVPLHIGHVRTLLLGSKIAAESGIEFHVRLDMNYVSPDKSDCVVDITNCLNTIGIKFDSMYCVGFMEPNYDRIGDKIGAENAQRLERALKATHLNSNHGQITAMLDDLIDYAPSLIIRGMEFKRIDAENCGVANVPGMLGHVAVTDFMDEFLGYKVHEFNVPLIVMPNGQKMGKSLSSLPWSMLTMVDRELVKKFLLATAMCPKDPFSAIDEEFASWKVSKLSYEWSWDDYTKLVKMC